MGHTDGRQNLSSDIDGVTSEVTENPEGSSVRTGSRIV